MRILIFLFICGFVFASCESKPEKSEKEEESRTINQIEEPIDSLVENIIQNGDTNSFFRASIYYLDYHPEAYLPLAVKMADLYKYRGAYMEVFHSLIAYENPDSLQNLNRNEEIIAFYYLKLAADLGHAESKSTVSEFEKDGLNLDEISTLYLSDSTFYKNYLDSLCKEINSRYKIFEE